ncbi:MAG: hypothetical protein ACREHD_00295, partial [Pirellulales bacterium]
MKRGLRIASIQSKVMACVLEEKSQERPTPASASAPHIWARPAAWRDNLVVVTAEELIVATVQRSKLADVVDALESGIPSHELLGPQETRVGLCSIVSLAAPLNTTRMVVEFEQQRRKFATRRFAVHDREAQGEILEQVALHMGPRASYVRTAPKR